MVVYFLNRVTCMFLCAQYPSSCSDRVLVISDQQQLSLMGSFWEQALDLSGAAPYVNAWKLQSASLPEIMLLV